MKPAPPTLIAVAAAGVAATASAGTMEQHSIVSPQEINGVLRPPRAPTEQRRRSCSATRPRKACSLSSSSCRRGYSVPPHTHPVDEVVTVISGTLNLGMEETAERSSAQPLPAGSFFALPPGTAHYVFIDTETVIQISTTGPWGLTYVNPARDPRQKS